MFRNQETGGKARTVRPKITPSPNPKQWSISQIRSDTTTGQAGNKQRDKLIRMASLLIAKGKQRTLN